jgi:hypothetical protein
VTACDSVMRMKPPPGVATCRPSVAPGLCVAEAPQPPMPCSIHFVCTLVLLHRGLGVYRKNDEQP